MFTFMPFFSYLNEINVLCSIDCRFNMHTILYLVVLATTFATQNSIAANDNENNTNILGAPEGLVKHTQEFTKESNY